MSQRDHDFDHKAGHSIPPATPEKKLHPSDRAKAENLRLKAEIDALAGLLEHASLIIVLLARNLPRDNARRTQAVKWLADNKLIPEVMRDE